MTTFNGATLVITLDNPVSGVLNVDVETDLYSEWKLWAKTGDNLKFPPAFRNAGGDPLSTGIEAGAYFFLRNDLGWRIISSDANQTINYLGNLVGESSALPIINVTPGRSVLHLGLQPVTQGVDDLLTELQNASAEIKIVKQFLAGKAVVSMDDLTVTVYDTDNTTILRTLSISADGRIRTPI